MKFWRVTQPRFAVIAATSLEVANATYQQALGLPARDATQETVSDVLTLMIHRISDEATFDHQVQELVRAINTAQERDILALEVTSNV